VALLALGVQSRPQQQAGQRWLPLASLVLLAASLLPASSQGKLAGIDSSRAAHLKAFQQ
jgi:hypothetical protein